VKLILSGEKQTSAQQDFFAIFIQKQSLCNTKTPICTQYFPPVWHLAFFQLNQLYIWKKTFMMNLWVPS